jgi:hypothetical protein
MRHDDEMLTRRADDGLIEVFVNPPTNCGEINIFAQR